MVRSFITGMIAVAAMAATAAAVQQQFNNDPFPPIETTDGLTVSFVEFATIPDANDQAPRMMHFDDEPGTRRIFVNTMRGPLYSVSYDGKTVTEYLDVNATNWGIGVQSQGSERGFQSFAFHPQFNQQGYARLREVLYLHRHDATSRRSRTFPSPATEPHARHGAARVDGEGSGGGDVRRRPRRACCSAWGIRSRTTTAARSDSTRLPRPRQSGLRAALRRLSRRRQRRRSVQLRAEHGVDLRQDPAHRSARQEQRERSVRDSGEQSVREEREAGHARRDLRATACAIRSASRGTRRRRACTSPISARTRSRKSAR